MTEPIRLHIHDAAFGTFERTRDITDDGLAAIGGLVLADAVACRDSHPHAEPAIDVYVGDRPAAELRLDEFATPLDAAAHVAVSAVPAARRIAALGWCDTCDAAATGTTVTRDGVVHACDECGPALAYAEAAR